MDISAVSLIGLVKDYTSSQTSGDGVGVWRGLAGGGKSGQSEWAPARIHESPLSLSPLRTLGERKS